MKKYIEIKSHKVLFCSDLHFSHNKSFCVQGRGFQTIEEHDNFLWNALENFPDKENTTLINLGDVCLQKDQNENFDRLSKIPFGQHLLINGNHTAPIRAYSDALKNNDYPTDIEVYPLKYNSITYCGNVIYASIQGQLVCLSHFPYFIWDGMQFEKPCWMLHGHCHSNNEYSNFSDSILGKCFDCGVDNALKYTNHQRPFFYWEEICEIMKNKTVKLHDHHDGTK